MSDYKTKRTFDLYESIKHLVNLLRRSSERSGGGGSPYASQRDAICPIVLHRRPPKGQSKGQEEVPNAGAPRRCRYTLFTDEVNIPRKYISQKEILFINFPNEKGILGM